MGDDGENSDQGTAPPAAVEPAPRSRPKGDDVVVIHGRTSDGSALGVSRLRQGRVEVGIVQPLEQGKPIHGEVVRLSPRAECPLICDVDVDVSREEIARALPASKPDARASEPPSRAGHGPAQVATDQYRRNWDLIWASKKKISPPS